MVRGLQTVVIGTSLGETSDDVVRTGLALSRSAGAKVHLVHACGLPLWLGVSPRDSLEAISEELIESLEGQLLEQSKRLGISEGELAGRHCRIDPPHRILLEIGRELDADLIVIGADEGERRWGRGLGSNADRVLRKATRPVLIVRGQIAAPPERVLIPVDLSTLSADAVRGGLEILAGLSSRHPPEVELLFVLRPYDRKALPELSGEKLERAAREELDRFVETHVVGDWPKLRTAISEGDPREEILAEVETWQADLVIMGTHGRSGFERFMLGSVTAAVAGRAPCSVLVIPPEAALKAAIALEQQTQKEEGA